MTEDLDWEIDGAKVARRLRRLRISQGYSQRELAILSGDVNRQRTIGRWEAGKNMPMPGPALRAVSAVLRVTPGFVLFGTEEVD